MSAAPRIPRGASQGKLGWGKRLGAWRKNHRSSALGSFARLWRTPLQTLMTCLVVAIALALPAALTAGLNNLQALGERWDAQPKISVFINPLAKPEAIAQLQRKINTWPEVAEVRFISSAEALAEFQAQGGFGNVLSGLDDNPLPPTLVIEPGGDAVSPAVIELLLSRLQGETLADSVQYDLEWVKKLQAIMALGEQIALGLATLLSLGVLLAIGNTIRLEIENRREEIVVIKLVGGTDAFVRRPFLYTGAWYGLIGGALAMLMVFAAFAALAPAVAQLATTYGSNFRLQGLNAEGALSLLAIGVGLGLFGARLAVGRHLSDIEPK